MKGGSGLLVIFLGLIVLFLGVTGRWDCISNACLPCIMGGTQTGTAGKA